MAKGQELDALHAHYCGLLKKNAKGFERQGDGETLTFVTPWLNPRNKTPIWLGMVEKRADYVSVHVMAIYVFADLAARLSPALKKRLVGKSCFKFKTLDAEEAKEIGALWKEGAARLAKGPTSIA